MSLGIYVHIPYCIKKCSYCDFYSYSNMSSTIPEYFEMLIKEINDFKHKDTLENNCADTVFIGGGTPSSVEMGYISRILETIKQNFMLEQNCEISIEVNPGSVNENKLKEYREAGINRISFGLQSAVDTELSHLGRIHKFDDYKSALKYAVNQGFSNINTDIIFGIPGQTVESFRYTLDRIFEENIKNDNAIKHWSVYGLIIEEGTPFYNLHSNNLLDLPDENTEREMYELAVEYLKENGFNQYEISNFAIKGYECRHNIKYWKTDEYIGFGVSAHSYINGKRSGNYNMINDYISNGKYGKYTESFEEITKLVSMKEFMMLGLRMTDGIDKREFFEKYDVSCGDMFQREISKLTGNNLIKDEENRISLTKKGLDLANLAFMEFV